MHEPDTSPRFSNVRIPSCLQAPILYSAFTKFRFLSTKSEGSNHRSILLHHTRLCHLSHPHLPISPPHPPLLLSYNIAPPHPLITTSRNVPAPPPPPSSSPPSRHGTRGTGPRARDAGTGTPRTRARGPGPRAATSWRCRWRCGRPARRSRGARCGARGRRGGGCGSLCTFCWWA